MAAVSAMYYRQSNGGSSADITIDTAIPSGATIYVIVVGNRSTPRTITNVAGLGATWTEVSNLSTSRFVVYRGTGGSGSGLIDVDFSGTQTATAAALVVTGANAGTLSLSQFTTTTGTSLDGPSQSAGNGQVVLAAAVSTNLTWPSAQTPSGAYTTTGGTASGVGYAAPTSTADHRISVSSTTSQALYIGQIVVGEVAAPASPTVALSGSIATPSWALGASFDLDVTPLVYDVALAGSLDAPEWGLDAQFSLAVPLPADVEMAGTLQAPAWVLDAAFGLTATPLPAALDLDGSLTAPTWTLTGDFALTPESALTPIDLSTFIDIYASTSWDGTTLSGIPVAYFTFPLVVDPAVTYTVEIDYTYASEAGTGAVHLWSVAGPNDAQVDVSTWSQLAQATEVTGSGTLELTMGPGIESWAAAVAAGERYVLFEVDTLDITAIRVSPALASPTLSTPVGTEITREGGRSRGGYAVAAWEPPVVPEPGDEPLSERHVGAVAFSAVTMDGAQPVYSVSAATKKRMRHRIMVGGKDVSFYRGAPTPEPSYKLGEPLLWGDTSIDFPQIAAAFETPGELTAVSDLRWCAKGKPVVLQRVNAAGEIVAVDYRGVVVAYDVVNGKLRLEVGGHATGRAALRHKPRPIFRDTLDLGRLAWAAVRDLGLRFEPRLGPTTGIRQALWGGMGFAEYVTELCAKAWQRDGTQWTLMPSEAGVYRMQRKDRATVDFTVFTDDKRNVANLRSDAAEEPNRVFAAGVTPRGQRVRFGVYPGLKPSRPAPYPFTDGRAFGFGTTDADTDTGDGITVMVRTLWAMGYLSLEDADPDGGFDADVRLAVDALQNDAGIHDGPLGYLDRGAMDTETWAALFDFDVTGFNLRGSRIEPAAQSPSTKRYRRSASGRIMGKNPHYDRHTLVVDRAIDFGAGFTRHQMREWARAEVDRGEDNWIGTIDITTGGVLHGQVATGAVIGGDDVMDVRAIKPGMNAWLPTFAGGIVVHVSGVDISYNGNGIPTAKLYVDTQARDRLAVWEIIRRNRESRRDPGRGWRGNRASGEIKDSVTEWDEVGGVLYDDAPLQPGWNVIPIVAGQEGEVSRIRLVVQDVTGGDGEVAITGREFACAVFGRKVSPKRLRTLIGNPLAASPVATAEPDPDDVDPDETDPETDGADPAPTVTASRPWWERKDIADELRALDILHSAGTREEPCGYSPGRKANGGTKTGLYQRDANFSYRTRSQPVLYLAVWVWGERTLSGGRVMWNQLEAGA